MAVTVVAQAQTTSMAIGSWQIHVPNQQAVAITETPTSIYTATEGGLFRFLKQENTLQTLSRIDGFSDMGIKSLKYDPFSQTLVVVYKNTNLDLVQNGRVINLTELLRKSMPGEKKAFHLYTHNKRAYLSTSFGLVVIDLVKHEIKDTYSNLGPQGQLVQVHASTVLNDSLYIATSQGLMGASLSNANLLDFRSWRRFGPADGLPQVNSAEAYMTIAAFNGDVYAGVNNSGLYRYTGMRWEQAALSTQQNEFRAMETNGNRLVITGPDELFEVTAAGQVRSVVDELLQDLAMAIPAEGTSLWAASQVNGLVRVTGNSVEAFAPNGPGYVDAFRVYVEPSRYTILAGGYNQSYRETGSSRGFYQFQNGQWESFHRLSGGQMPNNMRDFVDAARNPVTGKFYLASYGGGLLEFNGLEEVKLYNHLNSPLVSSLPDEPVAGDYVRVTSLAADDEGSLWVVNRNRAINKPGLFELKPDGTWVSYNIPYLPGTSGGTNFDQILIDELGYKWLSISNNANPSGIVVYDSEGRKFKYIGAAEGLPNAQVYSMALDQNGEVWVGTGSGVAVFSSSADVFSSSFAGAYLPIYERRPLLDGQIVRSIAVDAGNRKWIGTDTGLWLFNETGEELIHSFTTKNSPLPSDKINDIGINNSNGDVVIATGAGVAIYRSAATLSEVVNKDCLQVFPNPVRAGYTGSIGINGLPNNGWVKITDTAGLLVFEGKANGGTFAWNGRDYNGNKAKPGVYVVMATSADGSQTCTAKVAVQ
ncbi:type IX secretion system anionic LPS delivery protein PorZ [Rufibacter roseus]|uniref:Two-component regulator propeller domain-containing protein n=2 Tax=Rufibacter roseus TaxID=1567108 RepID=A0ABW2DH94_9BACT|nr:two-component regulator propeller domain-containing protein [Rufibacter roseus]